MPFSLGLNGNASDSNHISLLAPHKERAYRLLYHLTKACIKGLSPG